MNYDAIECRIRYWAVQLPPQRWRIMIGDEHIGYWNADGTIELISSAPQERAAATMSGSPPG